MKRILEIEKEIKTFEGVDPAKKANEIYRQFLGKGIYEDLKSEFGGYGPFNYEP